MQNNANWNNLRKVVIRDTVGLTKQDLEGALYLWKIDSLIVRSGIAFCTFAEPSSAAKVLEMGNLTVVSPTGQSCQIRFEPYVEQNKQKRIDPRKFNVPDNFYLPTPNFKDFSNSYNPTLPNRIMDSNSYNPKVARGFHMTGQRQMPMNFKDPYYGNPPISGFEEYAIYQRSDFKNGYVGNAYLPPTFVAAGPAQYLPHGRAYTGGGFVPGYVAGPPSPSYVASPYVPKGPLPYTQSPPHVPVKSKSQESPPKQKSPNSTKGEKKVFLIGVDGIPPKELGTALQAAFGSIRKLHVINDKKIAFATFENPKQVQDAIAVGKLDVWGKQVKITEYKGKNVEAEITKKLEEELAESLAVTSPPASESVDNSKTSSDEKAASSPSVEPSEAQKVDKKFVILKKKVESPEEKKPEAPSSSTDSIEKKSEQVDVETSTENTHTLSHSPSNGEDGSKALPKDGRSAQTKQDNKNSPRENKIYPSKAVWCFLDATPVSLEWKPYSQEVTLLIERAFLEKKPFHQYSTETGEIFQINFQEMIEINLTNGIHREAVRLKVILNPIWYYGNSQIGFKPFAYQDCEVLETRWCSGHRYARIQVHEETNKQIRVVDFSKMTENTEDSDKVWEVVRQSVKITTSQLIPLAVPRTPLSLKNAEGQNLLIQESSIVGMKTRQNLKKRKKWRTLPLSDVAQPLTIVLDTDHIPTETCKAGEEAAQSLEELKSVLHPCKFSANCRLLVSDEKQAQVHKMYFTHAEQTFTFTFPKEWEQNNKEILVPLQPSEAEYASTLALFKDGGLDLTSRVVSIERIQNEKLWKSFEIEREAIKCQNNGVINQKILFHGISSEHVQAVISKGFDWRLNKTYTFGKGVYFHVKATDADSQAIGTQDGIKKVFVAEVIVGETGPCPNPNLLLPPEKNEKGELYDSVCDNVATPSLYVTFEPFSSYPSYLISYK